VELILIAFRLHILSLCKQDPKFQSVQF
jgi:hypothetical protein